MFGVFVGRPSTGSNVWILVTDTSYDLKKKSFLGKKKKDNAYTITQAKRDPCIQGDDSQHHTVRSYVITTPPPFISVTAPLPLWPHREEVRRPRGDCGMSAASFLESSGTN